MSAALSFAAKGRVKVLGLTLQPMTLGHRFLLAKHESAFISGERIEVSDLMLSVLTCSQPWRSAERMLNLPSRILSSFIWLWSQCLRWVIVPIEYNKFRAYIEFEHSFPEVDAPRAESETCSPFELQVLAMLMSEFHLTRDQALDMEIAEATALWAAQGERKGAHKLRSPRIASLWEYARRMDAEKFGAN